MGLLCPGYVLGGGGPEGSDWFPIFTGSAVKKLQLSPANSAIYAGYRKATRKGKKSKQRFEVKAGNLPRNLPSLLLDRKKQREVSSSPRTSKDERKEEGMSYSPLGPNLRLGSLRYGDYGLRTTAGRALSFVCSTGLSRANIER